METNGKKLREYADMNLQYWEWTPNVDFEVIFLGYDISKFVANAKKSNEAILYHFQQQDGTKKPCHVRSAVFSRMMSNFNGGDRLRIRRNGILGSKYTYHVNKVE